MLIDLPANWLDFVHPVYREHMSTQDAHPVQLATGVYQAQMWSFNHVIRSLIASEHPFDSEQQDYWRKVYAQEIPFDQGDAEYERITTLPHDSGVCDDYEQILSTWPQLLADSRPFIILLTELSRADQPERSGWRWSKWGSYIGTQNSYCDYLADEPEIEKIQLFHLYLLDTQAVPEHVQSQELLAGVPNDVAIELLH